MGLAFCSGVQAAGFVINDKSVSSLGSAFAGEAALAQDASTVYNNPAGMLQLDGSHLSVGLHRITTTAEFSDGGSNVAPIGSESVDVRALAPNFYYVKELAPDLRAGFGFNSPFGLGLEYDSDWLGRYHTITSRVRTFNLSPALAYRVNDRLSLGASLDVQYLDATLKQAVDFGTLCVAQLGAALCDGMFDLQPQQDDGTQRLTGDSWSWGYSLGLTYEFSPATRLGAVLHSRVQHSIEGRSDFTLPASVEGTPIATPFSDSTGEVDIELPAIAGLSLAHRAGERLTLLADYTWTGWSSNKELRVKFDNSLPDSVTEEDWNDVSRYSVGFNYRLDPAWLLRAGFAYDETPVPDPQHRTPKLPDADRRWFTLGANWAPSATFSVDLAYAYISVQDVPIDKIDGLGHRIAGSYDIEGDYASVQANWKF